jgi:hypothetical protein
MSDFENIDDELLSAYLDDELSPDERARVDARLAVDPAARQLLDQLRAASQAMHSLPHETVGQDLRESILRRAEAAMLMSQGGRSAAAATKPVATDGPVSLRDSLPQLTIGQTRRGWAWAALAMAAGLLIMVFQPGDRQSNDLSLVAASRTEEALDRVAATDRADVPELHKSRVAEPATAAPTAAEHDSFSYSESASAAIAPAASGAAAPLPGTLALDAAAAPRAPASPADSLSSLNDNGGAMANDGAVLARAPAPTGKFDVAASQPAREGGALAEVPAMRQLGDDANEAKGTNGNSAAGVTIGPAPATIAASGRRFAETPPQGTVGGEIRLGAAATGQPAPADALAKAPAQAHEQDFVVVHVVATPEALRNKSFDRVLTNNGILLEQPPKEEAASDSAREELAEKDNNNLRLRETSGQPQDESGKQPVDEVVIVAAPKSTIESCLADLKQDQQRYLSVSVDDATAQSRIAGDKAVVVADANFKKLATDLGTRFNRGTAPPQDVELSRRKYLYDYYAGRGEGTVDRRGLRGGFGGGGAQKQELEQEQLRASAESLELDLKGKLSEGRARRVRSWSFDDQRNRDLLIARGAIAEDRSSSSTPLQFGALPQEAQAPAAAAGDRLYVLFFLSPGTEPPAATPPSPPAENRQE